MVKLNHLLDIAKQDKDIIAVLLFGSIACKEQHPKSDIDICLMLIPQKKPYDNLYISHKRLEYLSQSDMDIQIYQQMPLYIKTRILKEAEILLVKNENLLYDIAIKTVKEFEDFKHIYNSYLDEVARNGS